MVIGVTTAATMWFATVVGLCLGDGQIILGSVTAILGFLVLSTLHFVETRLNEQQRAILSITIEENSISEEELLSLIEAAKVRVSSISVMHNVREHQSKFDYDVRWPAHKDMKRNPAVLKDIAKLQGLIEMCWLPAGTPLA